MQTFDLPHDIPDKEKLEKRFNLLFRLNLIVVFCIILADLYLIFRLVFYSRQSIQILALISVFIVLTLFWLQVSNYLFLKKADIDSLDDDDPIGKYSAGEIKALIKEVFQPYKNQEIPNIYVLHSGETRAAVWNSLLFNRIKVLNAIFISKPLFHILEKNELKAIISHELGHFYGYTSPLGRTRLFFFVLMGLLPVYLYENSGASTIWYFVGLWVFFYFAKYFLLGLLLFPWGKTVEYLCDYYAAERYGKLNIINALLTQAKRGEFEEIIMEMVVKKIKKDNTLSIAKLMTIFDIINEKLPDKTVIPEEELKAIIKASFESEEIGKFRKELTKPKIKQEDKIIEKFINKFFDRKDFQLIDWNLFDFAEKNMRINEYEYPYLIKTLIEHPEGQLFNSVLDNKKKNVYVSHPTFGERILFLEKSQVRM
jgi:Zn-dependent protease with chaperone function